MVPDNLSQRGLYPKCPNCGQYGEHSHLTTISSLNNVGEVIIDTTASARSANEFIDLGITALPLPLLECFRLKDPFMRSRAPPADSSNPVVALLQNRPTKQRKQLLELCSSGPLSTSPSLRLWHDSGCRQPFAAKAAGWHQRQLYNLAATETLMVDDLKRVIVWKNRLLGLL